MSQIPDPPPPVFMQAVMWSLLLFVLATPFMVCQLVNHVVLAPAICFLSVWAFACLNEVARELEEPFMADQNDVALGVRPALSRCRAWQLCMAGMALLEAVRSDIIVVLI